MHRVSVSGIITYPVKSLAGVSLPESEVLRTGLRLDRCWAVVNSDGEIITGREHPKLLGISIEVQETFLQLTAPDGQLYQLTLYPAGEEMVEIRLFKRIVRGISLGSEAAHWFSNYLGVPCSLVMLGEQGREMQAKYGGKEGDIVSYADTSPLHVVSEESLAELNTRLASPVLMHRFRPNIVVQGCQPYEEDQWKYIRIGDCEFEVNEHCKRCVFTTIDPVLQQKDEQQEPLRTLSAYRKNAAGAVTFGVNLIPRKLGTLQVGQKIEVLTERTW
ncbi:MAG: MOSC domain-containing protein [Cyclobacteriaceae bacterium]